MDSIVNNINKKRIDTEKIEYHIRKILEALGMTHKEKDLLILRRELLRCMRKSLRE